MDVTVRRTGAVRGVAAVPGDKSIAHRWLMLASIGHGRSEVRGLPAALDVRSTARVCATLLPSGGGAALEGWAANPPPIPHAEGSTANGTQPRPAVIGVEARGRGALETRADVLGCGNSGTTMRLMAGILAAAPVSAVLTGDESLSRRPMDRIAEPLRLMGARISTTDGHAPLHIEGRALAGIEYAPPVASAQVKSAVLLAGIGADGATGVIEPIATRDHTERALEALGAPIQRDGATIRVSRFEPDAFSATVPGDVSSAAFLLAAAAATGGTLRVEGVGLNPSRTFLLEVLRRMGATVRVEVERSELGEPVGVVEVEGGLDPLRGVTLIPEEVPLVIDEVPVLAVLAATASTPSRFVGAGELRHKESDRLAGVMEMIRRLGGGADVEGDDLIVGGGALDGGGVVDPHGDHRMAMAAAVAALASREPVTVKDAACADVSFPGFFPLLATLGAEVS